MRRLLSTAFDPGARWALHPSVAVRPEPFGALLYHFGNRRLSFLKDVRLLSVVRALGEHPSALSACSAAGIGATEQPAFTAALSRLAGSDIIVPRPESREPESQEPKSREPESPAPEEPGTRGTRARPEGAMT